MRRIAPIIAFTALVCLVPLALAVPQRAGRQDATPDSAACPIPSEADLGEPPTSSGVFRDTLGTAAPAAVPGCMLRVHRIVLPPGGTVSEASYARPVITYVESGSLTVTIADGEAQFYERSEELTVAPTPVPAGESKTLETGDSILLENDRYSVAVANDSPEPAVVLNLTVGPDVETCPDCPMWP